ncbi:bifunctional proline dehydrogenase/pyrroline-5-carboxylate dehydrogenase [Catenovulum agarivorans DS-2]|uniref:Bifunctional protein PutA n=1 Tax=Catenovulum agarivorans DS-2 TaxID=1328313 RepID=W7QBH8_9ALTE|nr:bifunctional proline dehydrogenase/L-glutamate gamma-semialdehyde dehydrogenase PutA [Catenovulum agarivorans]EWH10159.1 bifunctional proline dehydrogenase/pyrroline-5-carboxylate dehydrogenase [Catenovulum agarivorans DS-2]
MQLTRQIFTAHLPENFVDLYTLKQALYQCHLIDDQSLVPQLRQLLTIEFDKKSLKHRLQQNRLQLKAAPFSAESFFSQLDLFSAQGSTLLRLAEALLRINDTSSAVNLIQDKLDYWQQQNHQHPLEKNSPHNLGSVLHNLLALSHYLLGVYHDSSPHQLNQLLHTGIKHISAPAIYLGMKQSMQHLAQHFVYAEGNQLALTRANQSDDLCSFDCLGEAAVGENDAKNYFGQYHELIHKLAEDKTNQPHAVSIKLSALHGRFGNKQYPLTKDILVERVLTLALAAQKADIALTIDAEEADKLMVTLDLFATVRAHPKLQQWQKLGIAVQAYSKRSLIELLWLNALGDKYQCYIPVRLVKGAYWDSEIKLAQQQGLANYPVFRQKQHTDLNYLVCAQFLLSPGNAWLQPQFAGHNIVTVSQIEQLIAQNPLCEHPIEWQKLYGMGSVFFNQFCQTTRYPIRQYAPIGSHKTVLPYLIRRILENGANQSFVHQIANENISLEQIIRNNTELADTPSKIANPPDIFANRKNSPGIDLADCNQQSHLDQVLNRLPKHDFFQPLDQWLNEQNISANNLLDANQQQIQQVCAQYAKRLAKESDYAKLFVTAEQAQLPWRNHLAKRVEVIQKLAEQLILQQHNLLFLLIYEAGKNRQDALNEWREALDFCYYYSEQIKHFYPRELEHTAGENNTLYYQAKGTFVCISPWNFPLAIFLGQIVAALITGNTVIAKPAHNTQLIGHFCQILLEQAGLPHGVLQLVTGSSKALAEKLLNYQPNYHDKGCYLAGVCFTGSNHSAKTIQQQLHSHPHTVKLIAETGGINIMLADASALLEQVIRDVIESAFASAGQRCSATRVLVVHQSIYSEVKNKLIQAMAELTVDEPQLQTTDVTALIDQSAKDSVEQYLNSDFISARIIYQSKIASRFAQQTANHNFVPPTLIEIEQISQIQQEVFAPVLHICAYQNHHMVLKQLQNIGYGLTMAVHTRNQHLWQQIAKDVQVGNVYINRNQVGAVVGCQAFGGMNLSGTGPKAGGPNYLAAFLNEKLVCENTAAIGGSLDLYD